MNTPPPRKPNLTLVGFPVYSPQEADPFPLTPYRDVATSYTPSHARPARHYESTPVYIPPARRSPPPIDNTRAIARPALEPSRVAKMMAAAIVCYVIAMLVAATF
jgi:hypothetical protein